jgi:hypothetical protein
VEDKEVEVTNENSSPLDDEKVEMKRVRTNPFQHFVESDDEDESESESSKGEL